MVEAPSGTLEAKGKLNELTATSLVTRGARRCRSRLDDPLDPLDVDEVEGQRALARHVDAPVPVLAHKAQQGLSLAELGPREVALEQPLHERSDVLAMLASLLDHAIRISHRVARFLLGVVVAIE